MKLGKIVDPSFQLALKKLMAEQLPLKVAFQLKGISTKVSDEINKYEEVRQAALHKHGKKDESGELLIDNGQVQIEDPAKFAEEINALLDLDIAVDGIKFDALGDVKISVRELIALDEIIKP